MHAQFCLTVLLSGVTPGFYRYLEQVFTMRHSNTTLHLFNGLFSRTAQVSRHQKGKPFWILMKQEMMGGNGISWTIRRSFVHRSREITMPVHVPNNSVFYRLDALPAAKPTASKHWRHYHGKQMQNICRSQWSSGIMPNCNVTDLMIESHTRH